jgi:hypothetical protein
MSAEWRKNFRIEKEKLEVSNSVGSSPKRANALQGYKRFLGNSKKILSKQLGKIGLEGSRHARYGLL